MLERICSESKQRVVMSDTSEGAVSLGLVT